MKILWLCNIILPKISEHLQCTIENFGGWLTGLSNDLLKSDDIELAVCFPFNKKVKGKLYNLQYYGFQSQSINYNDLLITDFKSILSDFSPDIVHIFGTEYHHSLAMVKAFNNPDRTIISIQGLVSVISRHYTQGLPCKTINAFTFRDFIKQDNIKQQARKFKQRGKYEIEALKGVNHIIGRTDWDRACTMQINPNAKYHFCNETLRDEFYKHRWSYEECEKYSIFVSQASYPLKGFHFVLEALPEIIKRFPKTHIYVAGKDLTKIITFKDKMRTSYYGKYIKKLISENNLENHITFLGDLSEKEMCTRYLKSNVFVSASSIENSPNSVGEAMILGVPIVSSDVGGVKNLLTHGEEGYIYQHDAPYMLAFYVCEIFSNNEIALRFSENSIKHANTTHSKENNLKSILTIYKEVSP